MMLARRNNDNWLANWFNDNFFDTDIIPQFNTTAPAVNVKENEKSYIMDIAAPGIKKEFVRVNVDKNNCLHIAIENKMEHKSEDKHEHYLRREFSYTNYEQSYTLPDNVDADKISAKVDNGVLEIELPKYTREAEDEQTKKIEVL
jgi:HSP20 family protein